MLRLIFIKRHILRFKRNQQGAVLIEFLFSVVMLLSILFFMFDLTLIRGNMGKLDNLSYSLASLLRERTLLYVGKDGQVGHTLSDQDLNTFRKLAKVMFYGDPNDGRPLYLVLDSLIFRQTRPNQPNQLDGRNSKKLGDIDKCHPTTDLKNVKDFAPKSEQGQGRVLPLYQVTVCVPSTPSFFGSFFTGNYYESGMLRSSSITLSR